MESTYNRIASHRYSTRKRSLLAINRHFTNNHRDSEGLADPLPSLDSFSEIPPHRGFRDAKKTSVSGTLEVELSGLVQSVDCGCALWAVLRSAWSCAAIGWCCAT